MLKDRRLRLVLLLHLAAAPCKAKAVGGQGDISLQTPAQISSHLSSSNSNDLLQAAWRAPSSYDAPYIYEGAYSMDIPLAASGQPLFAEFNPQAPGPGLQPLEAAQWQQGGSLPQEPAAFPPVLTPAETEDTGSPLADVQQEYSKEKREAGLAGVRRILGGLLLLTIGMWIFTDVSLPDIRRGPPSSSPEIPPLGIGILAYLNPFLGVAAHKLNSFAEAGPPPSLSEKVSRHVQSHPLWVGAETLTVGFGLALFLLGLNAMIRNRKTKSRAIRRP